MSNVMKIRPVGAELLHTDGWTDGRRHMTKLVAAFRNFVKAPTDISHLCLVLHRL
jgi:hypothetical protein